MKHLRVHLAQLLTLVNRLFEPTCPVCRQPVDDCVCPRLPRLPDEL